ncbi:MAG: hypothetical protein LBO66_14990 [Deltaproteobacteria bacterium]|nr:hypothetical protein [Deltaproteobacteria bacterium]
MALLALGPEDPRVWAALSRSARSLFDFAANAEDYAESFRKFCARAAASIAMGALNGFDEAARAAAKGAGEGPPLPRISAAEKDFARRTLELIDSVIPRESRASFAPRAERSLAEAFYPIDGPILGRAGQTPVGALFPSTAELRAALARAENPGGPGQGSRAAFSLRSRLGLELWDSGGAAAAREATELLSEASRGLDRLLGPGALESLAAKERLARRLAGLYGYGKIIPSPTRIPAEPELAAARELFRELRKFAPRGKAGTPFKKRALMGSGAAGVGRVASATAREEARDILRRYSIQAFPEDLSIYDKPSEICEYGDGEGVGRMGFDASALALRAGFSGMGIDATHVVLALRRNVLGGRHPETACSLALLGDTLTYMEGSLVFWSLALEALEGRGGRYAVQEADLKCRLGRVFLSESDDGQAAAILAEAEKLYLDSWGETCQERLECAALRAEASRRAGNLAVAEEIYRSLLALLDGAPLRRDPEPTLPSDGLILALALAGTASAMFSRGERAEASRLMKRALEIRAREGGDSFLGTAVDSRARALRSIL